MYTETPYSKDVIELNENNGRPIVKQGFIETSNLNIVTEMVRMIETHRAYEANQKSVQTADEIMGIISNRLGRIQ
jgi:flagellar basal-body rod protein FlgG